ncbi:proline iminopeptidase-family hydrolase [Crocinitomix catalasitica]|uniref:proline iminopeptidase-family hydrolase n=1 Tax=Crocinitomix catalasitica TaxID=184607 RepID=UPI0006872123|nr:proline iminopeptidase-family hydrolase [Crocinitomix catalasitica]
MQQIKILITFTCFFLVLIGGSTALAGTNPTLKASEGYVEVNGGKMWYRILGEGNEAPLLMMHGGPGGTSRSFYLFEKLTKDQPIILFDQFGSGRSDHHQDTNLLKVHEFVAQVKALTSHLNLNEFYLYGHSWGTALALEYYVAHPQGVKGIIFNSPYFSTAIWEADADTLIMALPDTIQKAIAMGEKTGDFSSPAYQNANRIYLANYGLRKKGLSSDLDTVVARGNYFIYNYMWGPTEFTANGTLKTYDNIAALKKISVPTLFITGEYDEARPETLLYFQQLVPNSQVAVIKGAGHATMHDNLPSNTKVMRKFLKKANK